MVDIKRILYRLPKQGKIAGVCAGLAEYFDMDVTLMRVIFVLLLFATGGAMIFIYIILAIILPVAGERGDSISEKVDRLGHDLRKNKVVLKTRNYVGFGLIIIGVWLLLGQFIPQLFDICWDYTWPIALIIAGLMVIVRRGHDK